jgi:hypothetical protein
MSNAHVGKRRTCGPACELISIVNWKISVSERADILQRGLVLTHPNQDERYRIACRQACRCRVELAIPVLGVVSVSVRAKRKEIAAVSQTSVSALSRRVHWRRSFGNERVELGQL